MTKMFRFNVEVEAERDKYLKIKSASGFEDKNGTRVKDIPATKTKTSAKKKSDAKPGPGEDYDIF